MTINELKKLFSELSLEEKLGEFNQMPGEFFQRDTRTTGENASLEYPQEIVDLAGSALNVETPELIIEVQKKHMERHPHHIPMLFMLDIIHGYHTTFPIPLAQGCSFEPELVTDLASAAAKEACATGLHVTFSPMVDLSRDARWGRVMESSGEDPYLNSIMAAAAVKGYQGDDLTKEGTISACVKHFAAYGAVEGGREYGSVDVSERNLRQYYLPSYKAACDAGCGMLMCAFNEIGGVPATANKHLMKEILRDKWGFEGAVITDYGSLNNMQSHGISDNDEELAKLALDATVDIEMCVGRYASALPELLKKGEITLEQIDEGAWRVLNLKNRLGLFENPFRFADPEKAKEIIRSKEILDLARESVSKTSVLLKNDGELLPLDRNQKIAFIGPFLEERDLLGGWAGKMDYKDKTVREVIEERFVGNNLIFDKGCKLYGCEQPEIIFHDLKDFESDTKVRQENIAKAAAVAASADTVVLLLGEHPRIGGELNSKVFIEIPWIQQELFRAVTAVNDNVAVVLFNHRPLDLREITNNSKAILDVWFPGTMGAEGIVDMLFGDRAPTGRLTMSFPYSVGQVPIYYNMLPTDHSADFVQHYVTGYVDAPLEPLYSFGEGLTYTEFEYGEITLDRSELREGEVLKASVEVKNIGKRDGFETVQLYIRDVFASVSRPKKELKRFKKLHIKAGQTVKVEFELSCEDMKFYNVELEHVWEPGEIKIFIGHDSRCQSSRSVTLVK